MVKNILIVVLTVALVLLALVKVPVAPPQWEQKAEEAPAVAVEESAVAESVMESREHAWHDQ